MCDVAVVRASEEGHESASAAWFVLDLNSGCPLTRSDEFRIVRIILALEVS
jgi:hypothetical protein